MKKIIIALSLLLLSAMAGCSIHRNYYGWERRHWEGTAGTGNGSEFISQIAENR